MNDETILHALMNNASILPPAWLDRKILQRIRRRPVLRPFLAAGLAAAFVVTVTGWLAFAYAQTRIGDQAVLAAVVTVLAYMAFCGAALTPVLIHAARTRGTWPHEMQEGQP